MARFRKSSKARLGQAEMGQLVCFPFIGERHDGGEAVRSSCNSAQAAHGDQPGARPFDVA